MRIIALDWETYFSSRDYTLSKMSPVAYIRDPRFTPLCMGVCIWDSDNPDTVSPTLVFEAEDIPAALEAMKLDQPGKAVLGHNMSGFDALILSEYYKIKPYMILDTICCARWCGISRMMSESHGVLTDYLKHGIKQAGTVVSNGKKSKSDFTPDEWTFFKQYCADDTQQCMENFLSMLPYLTLDALKFQSITAKMGTEPTLMLDQQMLEGYIRELDDRAEKSMQEVSKLFHFTTKEEFLKAIRSADKFCNMLRQLDCEPPMKYSDAKSESKRKTMEAQGMDTSDPDSYAVYTPALAKTDLEFLDLLDHPDPRVELLVQSRLDNNSSMEKSRALRLLETSKTGKPLPVMLKAFAAHTGRYGAGVSEGATDGNNLQNLSKRDPKKLTLRRAIQAPAGYKLIACDLSQIEARLLAYEACQDDLLDQFAKGEDSYSILAEAIFNVPWREIKAGAKSGDKKLKNYRNIGKLLVLSCGYGTSAQKLSNTLLRQGVHLHEDRERHAEEAKHCHSIYRLSNSAIVGFWKTCQGVLEHLAMGGSGVFGGPNGDLFSYGMMPVCGSDEPVPSVTLTESGYIMRYPNLRAEKNEKGRLEYFYDRQKGKASMKVRIYGASLTENLTQSLAFQVLIWQACRMHEAGIKIVSNVHDAFLAIAPDGEEEQVKSKMLAIMTSTPAWLPNFPCDAEGEIGDTYAIA